MSIRRPNNPRLSTPDDTASGESDGPDYQQSPPVRGLQQRRMMGRTVSRRENERRVTPADHGGGEREYLITIRKFDAATGEEIWNNGRGESYSIELNRDEAQCSQIYSLGNDKFLSCGSPLPGKSYGNLLRWADLGSGAAIVKSSRDATDDYFDCTSREEAVTPFRMAVGDNHIWLCGHTTASGKPRVVQAYDRTTLQATGALTLPDDEAYHAETFDGSYLTNLAPTSDGKAVVVRHVRDALVALNGRFELELRFVDDTPAVTASGEITLTNVPALAWTGSGTAFGTAIRYAWIFDYHLPIFTVANDRLWFAYLASPQTSPGEPRLASVGEDMVFSDHGALANFPRYATSGSLYSEDAGDAIGDIRIDRIDDGVVVSGNTTRVASGAQAHKYDSSGTLVDSWQFGHDAIDDAGSCFALERVSFDTKLVRRDAGTLVWRSDHATSVHVVRTSGGHHYCIGGSFVGNGSPDIFKLDGATGAILWSAQHSDGLGVNARDIIVVGDYVYVVGEGSTYEP